MKRYEKSRAIQNKWELFYLTQVDSYQELENYSSQIIEKWGLKVYNSLRKSIRGLIMVIIHIRF